MSAVSPEPSTNDTAAGSRSGGRAQARAEAKEALRAKKAEGDLLSLILAALVILFAVPLAVMVVPNTVSLALSGVLTAFDLSAEQAPQVIRVYGLALPALMVTIPPAAVLARRVRAWPVLLGGLLLMGAVGYGGAYVNSLTTLAAARVVQGVGAAAVLAGTLVWVCGRIRRGHRFLLALWGGVLVVSMLAATPLVYLLLATRSWRVMLQGYPGFVGVAMVLTAAMVIVHARRDAMPEPTRSGESVLWLPVAPAVGLSLLTLGSTYGWSTSALLVLAVASLIIMYALTALGGAFDGRPGTTHAVVATTVGVVVLPVIGQLTHLILPGSGGPGLNVMWVPLAVAAVLGVATSVAAALVPLPSAHWPVLAGLVTAGLGLVLLLSFVPVRGGVLLVAGCALVAVGMGLALGASMRGLGSGAAVLGLGIVFPAVMAGQLFSGAVRLRELGKIPQLEVAAQAKLALVHEALYRGLQAWLVISALVIALAALDILIANLRGKNRRVGFTSAEAAAEPTEEPVASQADQAADQTEQPAS